MSPPRCEKRGSSAAMLRASLVFHRGRYHKGIHCTCGHQFIMRLGLNDVGLVVVFVSLFIIFIQLFPNFWSWNRLISAYRTGIGCLTNSLTKAIAKAADAEAWFRVPSGENVSWHMTGEEFCPCIFRPALTDLNSTPYALAQSFQHDTRVY